jgi:asparagine synthase (glutamine-hydrolysing)
MVKLFGSYDEKRSVNDLKNQIVKMHKAIGIGSLDYECRKSFAVGHARIPTHNNKGIASNKHIIACFSGRIYDYEKNSSKIKKNRYKQNTQNAERFVLESYMKQGLDFVAKLNGQFVIIIYDNRTDTLYIINDRFGVKPLYYYADDNKLVFGSEIKAVLSDKKIVRDIDWSFWKDIFAYRFHLGTKTQYKNIKSLPNATILKYKDRKCTLSKYWDYDQIKINNKRSEEETITQGVKILKSVFLRHTAGLKECSVLLSGGYDSRCIASSIKHFTDVDMHVYTVAKSYSTPQKEMGDLDSKYSQQLCNKMNIKYLIIGNHHNIYEEYFIKHITLLDGITSESLWIMPLFDEINESTVIFEGLLGDILLRDGWLAYPDIADPRRPLNQYAENLHQLMIKEAEVYPESVCEFFDDNIKRHIYPNSLEVQKELSDIPEIPYRVKIFHLRNPTRNIHSLISNDVLSRKTDTIYPFCDNEFAEFAFSIPTKMKLRNIYFKILSRAFPDIMKIPSTNDPKHTKEKLQKNLRDMRLMPVWNSARSLKSNFSKILGSNKKSKIFRSFSKNPRDIKYLIKLARTMKMPKYINKDLLLKEIDKHISKDIDPTYFLEPIIHFCIWYNTIYKNKK